MRFSTICAFTAPSTHPAPHTLLVIVTAVLAVLDRICMADCILVFPLCCRVIICSYAAKQPSQVVNTLAGSGTGSRAVNGRCSFAHAYTARAQPHLVATRQQLTRQPASCLPPCLPAWLSNRYGRGGGRCILAILRHKQQFRSLKYSVLCFSFVFKIFKWRC